MKNPYQNLQDYENQTIDYEDFCKLTNEPILKDGYKTKQIKTLSNYMNIDSSYGKITINKVYNNDEMLLVKHRSKFTEYIEDLLVLYLYNQDGNSTTLTYREMAKYFYLVNKRYYEVKDDRFSAIDDFNYKKNMMCKEDDEESDEMTIYKNMGYFFNITDKMIKEIIDNALKSLEQQSIIIHRKNYKLYKSTYIPEIKKFINEEFICTKEQREKFLDIRNETMEQHGIKKMQDIIYMKKYDRENYFIDLAEKMSQCKELNYCDRYANAWDIEYGKEAVNHKYKRIMAQNKKLINANMKYKLLTTEEMNCILGGLRKQFVERLI